MPDAVLIDAIGRQRSKVTLPGYLAGRAEKGYRSTSSSASSGTPTWGPPARTCKGSIPSEIVNAVHSRRPPMMPASAALGR
jgi:hypothetical protein